jgi:aspartate aminotransferase
MTFRKSAALARIQPSATIAITQKGRDMRASGRDVISLSIGEPDFDTPDHIKQAAARKVAEGETKYPPVPGLPELRKAVAAKFERENGLDYTPDQVIISAGGKQVLALALLATLDPGDEVIVAAPYYVSYTQLIELAGATPVVVPTEAASNFLLTPEALEAAISERTRWLILNSPSNPTGSVYPTEALAALGAVLERHPQVWILSDDIYEHLIYDDAPFATIAATTPALKDRTLTMNGVSKAYAMTGWRIGYGAGPEPLIKAMSLLQSQLTGGASRVTQWAAHAALTGPQDDLANRRAVFRTRRDMVLARLRAIPGITCTEPQGAFYVFPSCSAFFGKKTPSGVTIRTDEDFCMRLLEEQGVATVQGSAFGQDGYFRISYAASDAELDEALRRLEVFCGSLDDRSE